MADANLDKSKLMIPGHGTVLVSVGEKADPFDPKNFVIGDDTTYKKSDWMQFGLTSKENTIEFSKDGGDTTAVDTWEFDGVDITKDPITWSFNIGSLSMQKAAWELAYGGGKYVDALKAYAMSDVVPVQKSVMIIFAHNGKRAGAYIRSARLSVGDAPSVDTEKFFETQLSGSVIQPDVDTWGKVLWFDARAYEAGRVV